MKEKVEDLLKEIANALKRDGGDIELVDIEDKVVKVRLKGSCAGCPSKPDEEEWTLWGPASPLGLDL